MRVTGDHDPRRYSPHKGRHTSILALLFGPSTATVACAVAIITTTALFAAVRWQASHTAMTAGFWFEEGVYALPEETTTRLGGPLTEVEIARIETVARREVERAFDGLRLQVTNDEHAFWRVVVLKDVHSRGPLPNAGQALGWGPLGGLGSVGFAVLAANGVQFAPGGATRDMMLEGIGRGIGRAAAHEFGHQILGMAAAHNDTDENSYEYYTSDRRSQYYGELHWTTSWPLFVAKVGVRDAADGVEPDAGQPSQAQPNVRSTNQ